MNSEKGYFNSIDLLRAITALLICTYHFIQHNDANSVLLAENNVVKEYSFVIRTIVYIFFMLSGFVITLSMHRQGFTLKKTGRFMARRSIRIEIPYIASILVYFFISYLWTVKAGGTFEIDIKRLFHHLVYTAPFFDYPWYNPVYWTLAVELQFYLLIALLFPLFTSKNKLIKYSSLVLFSLSGLFVDGFEIIFSYSPFFVVGILLFSWISDKENKSIDLTLTLGCLIQITYMFGIISACYILLGLIISQLTISDKNTLVRFGKRVYSFYLLHGAIGGSFLYFASKYTHNDFSRYFAIIIAIALSITLSNIFFLLIEKHSIRLSRLVKISKE